MQKSSSFHSEQAPQCPFENVVAQFIGQLCLMNQATTKFEGKAACTATLQGRARG